jgi:hypothetical protein
MNEYQLVDALNSTMAQSWTISQYGLSILTGYLLIAHFIGRKLTFFQVSFVNCVFLLMHILVVVSNIEVAKRVYLLSNKLQESGSDLGVQSLIEAVDSGTGPGWPAYLTGGLIGVGCLVFMWSVRHPRAGVEVES